MKQNFFHSTGSEETVFALRPGELVLIAESPDSLVPAFLRWLGCVGGYVGKTCSWAAQDD